ncbi:MAG: hypothetical protein ACRDS0_03795 [Pseudonocardiaceae bacterium]
MSSASSPGYSFNELAGMLHAAASGLYTAEAAVELLIDHQTWLERADFIGQFIAVEHDEDGDGYAGVDWPAALDALNNHLLPCSGSEANVFRVAASLAGQAPVTIGAVISGLDARNVTLVLNAIAHASGFRNTEVSLG